MALDPDIDRAFKAEAARNVYEKKLNALLGVNFREANNHMSYDVKLSLGKLRNLLAPNDTLAYPPSVLSTDVYTNPIIGFDGASGEYDLSKHDITLIPSINDHPGFGPYETLLHEAGHARGDSQSRHLRDKLGLLDSKRYIPQAYTEDYAMQLADSLLHRKPHRYGE